MTGDVWGDLLHVSCVYTQICSSKLIFGWDVTWVVYSICLHFSCIYQQIFSSQLIIGGYGGIYSICLFCLHLNCVHIYAHLSWSSGVLVVGRSTLCLSFSLSIWNMFIENMLISTDLLGGCVWRSCTTSVSFLTLQLCLKYQPYMELNSKIDLKESSAKYLELNSWMVLKQGKC